MPSLFAGVALAPRDPILGLNEAFAQDPRPFKVNLGVGVYYDDTGKVPLLRSVAEAEQRLVQKARARSYLPIEGLGAFRSSVQRLVLGKELPHAVTVQALGGTGALKIGADFLKRILPEAEVMISSPSWENHRALFEAAGFVVREYRYFDAQSKGIDFAGLCADLAAAKPRSIVVLHGCCHNPTGADLTQAMWQTVAEICAQKELVPFFDLAYQGFAEGIEADRVNLEPFLALGCPLLVANSFSKNFSLYGERVGGLTVVCAEQAEAERVLSQLKRVVRTNYSNPPTHGAAIIAEVLGDEALEKLWREELAAMRQRIAAMRAGLRERLEARVPGVDFSFITAQRGMFSYTGLSAEQVAKLQSEYAIYAVSSGRICIAALNSANLDRVAEAMGAVLRS